MISLSHQHKLIIFFCVSVQCLVGTTLAVPINTRQKRDILPGDARYGTDYHRQHHHHHDNEVEVTKAIGTYAGTYTEQLPHQQYGPPFYQPSQPLKDYTPVVEDVKKTVEQAAPVQVSFNKNKYFTTKLFSLSTFQSTN